MDYIIGAGFTLLSGMVVFGITIVFVLTSD